MIYTQEYLEDFINQTNFENYNLEIIIDELIKQNTLDNLDKNLIHTGGENNEFWL